MQNLQKNHKVTKLRLSTTPFRSIFTVIEVNLIENRCWLGQKNHMLKRVLSIIQEIDNENPCR
jgi:hypothetical protein